MPKRSLFDTIKKMGSLRRSAPGRRGTSARRFDRLNRATEDETSTVNRQLWDEARDLDEGFWQKISDFCNSVGKGNSKFSEGCNYAMNVYGADPAMEARVKSVADELQKKIELDPLIYTDDESEVIRDYARKIINGD